MFVEVSNVAKDKRGKKGALDREEYGYGFDIAVDDLAVIGRNNDAKHQKNVKNETQKQLSNVKNT